MLSMAGLLVTGASVGLSRVVDSEPSIRFVDETHSLIPHRPTGVASVAVGDVDGDGWPDLVLATDREEPGPPLLYMNQMGLGFHRVQGAIPDHDHASTRALLVDLDGDEDLDVVVANRQSGNISDALYRNRGDGHFELMPGFPSDGADTFDAVAFDADGDGTPDLAFADNEDGDSQDGPSVNRLYRNDGHGRFLDVSSTHLPDIAGFSNSIVSTDVNLDGQIDLVVGNFGMSQVLVNRDGHFRPLGNALPPFPEQLTTGLNALDVDFDGDPDLVVTASPFGSPGGNLLLINNGRGRFGVDPHFPRRADEVSWDTATADFDMDGDPDLVIANHHRSGQQDRYLENRNHGRFHDATSGPDGQSGTVDDILPSVATMSNHVIAADIDGDLSADLIFADRLLGVRVLISNFIGVACALQITPTSAEAGEPVKITLAAYDGRDRPGPIWGALHLERPDGRLLRIQEGPVSLPMHSAVERTLWVRLPSSTANGVYRLTWMLSERPLTWQWRTRATLLVGPGEPTSTARHAPR